MIDRDIELTDGMIVLRPANPDHAARLYVAIRESLDDLRPWMSWACDGHSIEDTQSWLDMQPEQWVQDRAYEFVIRDAATGDVLGACGLNNVNRAFRMANLGYWVRSAVTGRGIATRATRLLAQFAFSRLDLVRVEILAAVGNKASQRVAIKAGATREGTLRNRSVTGTLVRDAVMHSLVPSDLQL